MITVHPIAQLPVRPIFVGHNEHRGASQMGSLEIPVDPSLNSESDDAASDDGGLPSVVFKGFELGDESSGSREG